MAAATQEAPQVSFQKKGKLIARWGTKAAFSYPIWLDATYRGVDGKLVTYKDLNGLETTITLTPTRTPKGHAEHTFDLDNEEQEHQANFIRNYPFKKLGIKITLIDELQEARDYVSVTSRRNKLIARVEEVMSTAIGLRNLALNMGVEVVRKQKTMIEAAVLQKADVKTKADFDRVEAILNDPAFEIKAIVLYAKEKGVIESKNGNWFYGEIHLGTNVTEAVRYVQNHETVLTSISERVTAA